MTAQELVSMRKKMQMTQTQVAKAMGLSLQGYQKLEDGESNIREVYRLAWERLSPHRRPSIEMFRSPVDPNWIIRSNPQGWQSRMNDACERRPA